MSKTTITAVSTTFIAIVVFYLPVLEIYSGYYLGIAFEEASYISYNQAVALTPVFCAIAIILFVFFLSRGSFSAKELLITTVIPATALSFGSYFIGRYDAITNLLFIGTIAVSLGIVFKTKLLTPNTLHTAQAEED